MKFIFLFIPSGLNLFLLFNRGSRPRKGKILTTPVPSAGATGQARQAKGGVLQRSQTPVRVMEDIGKTHRQGFNESTGITSPGCNLAPWPGAGYSR